MAALPSRALVDLPGDHPCGECTVRDTAVCGVLKCDDLAALKNAGTTLELEAGKPLFREGDPATQVFNVTRGALELSTLLPDGRRQVVGFVLPGDFLGISVSGTHAFNAEALKPTTMCRFSRDGFGTFAAGHSELERELFRLAAHELAAAQAQMVLLGRKSAAERVASFLIDLAGRLKSPGVVDLPMSRGSIADYLGLTKETVSRVIGQLKDRKLIRLETLNRIELLDSRGLAAVADGLERG